MSEGEGRPLAPALAPQQRHDPSTSTNKKASIACEACKRIKRRCDQGQPCQNCRKSGKECVYDEALDNRRRITAKRNLDELDYHRNVLYSLFESIRAFEDVNIQRLLALIRHNASLDEIVSCIDTGLSELEEDDGNPTSAAIREKLHEARAKVGHLESPPRLRRKTMTVEDLNSPPILVPARPWTSVTDNDILISHLISLWFTWLHQYHPFIDRDLFLKDMRSGKTGSLYCSPFLVNVILSQACHFSDDPEACLVPGNLSTSGDHFYAEARRLWDAEEGKVKLSNVHAIYCMVIKATIIGKDRVGWMFLHQLNSMYRELGWEDQRHGKSWSPGADAEGYARISAMTAHSVPIVNVLYGLAFLQPQVVKNTWMERPFLEEEEEVDTTVAWEPYPMLRPSGLSRPYRIFDELCKLSQIGIAVQDLLFNGTQNEILGTALQHAADEIYQRLLDWFRGLPSWFDVEGDVPPTPDVFELHCNYHWILMTLFHFLKYPINNPSDLPKNASFHIRAHEICCGSAERVAHFAGIYRNGYGLSRVPLVLVQAGNVAALTLVDELATSAYRDAFHDICVVLVAASRRMPLVKGKVRMIWLMVEQRHIDLPPETKTLLKDFSNESWKNEEHLRFSSTYPNYAVAKESDDVWSAGMSDLLERWEAARRVTEERLEGNQPKEGGLSHP